MEERQQNLLGEDNPQVLDTVFYYVGLYLNIAGRAGFQSSSGDVVNTHTTSLPLCLL